MDSASLETQLASCILDPRARAAIAERLHEALLAHAGYELAPEPLLRYLEPRLREAPDPEQLHLEDALLAHATLAGSREALRTLDGTLIEALDPVIAGAGAAPSEVEEIKQRIRERLVVGTADAPPLLTRYSARGPLRAWLRVVAAREALQRGRRRGRESALPDDALGRLVSPEADPELAFIKAHYRQGFAESFSAALGELSPEDRTYLRFSLLDGLTSDEIGRIQRIHRSTAARRVARAKQAVLRATRLRLAGSLGLGQRQLESVLRLIESRLELTLGGLRTHDDDPTSHRHQK